VQPTGWGIGRWYLFVSLSPDHAIATSSLS
jgi:hypothetical protein